MQDSWIDGFAATSPFRLATERVDRQLHGTHVLLVHIEFERDAGRWPRSWDRAGPLLDPGVLEAIGAVEQRLRVVPDVGGVLGAHSHLEAINYLFLAQQEGTRRIPESPERVSLIIGRFEQVRGKERRREVIHDDLHRTVLTVFLRNANYRDTARLMERVREYEREYLAPLGGRVEFGGDVALSQAMIPAIVHTQLGSLLLAGLGAFLTVALLTRSRRTAVLAILPTAVAVVWLFGAMGWLGIPIGVATSTFCAITLGIGVDYAVHFLERMRRADEAGVPDVLPLAASEAAPAILADAFAVALGFGLLGLSAVPANARLGVVIAVALLASAALSLFGLGALVARAPLRGSSPPRVADRQGGRLYDE